MARALTTNMDARQLSRVRSPAWKVLIYDVRSTADTIQDIVLGGALAALTGPRDFTDDVVAVQINEVAGDYLANGVAATTVTGVVSDPAGVFDPFNVLADPTSDGRWLRAGNVIRIVEGDEAIDESEWATTFTGILVGQAGQLRTRVGGAQAQLTFKAVGREAEFLKQKVTSSDFGTGVAYRTIAETIAQEDLGLDADEIVFANWGTTVTALASNQFVQLETLVAIANLMFVDGFMPKFDGEGKLSQTTGVTTQAPSRFYANNALINVIERVFNEASPPNRVVVKGLNGAMDQILQARQPLAEVSLTTGYFARNEEIDVVWSDDGTQYAQNVELNVLQSIAGNLIPFGSETFTETPEPEGGSLGGVITVSTGFAPYVVIFLTGVYVGLEAIPEPVQTVPVEGSGFTLAIRSVISATALSSALFLMGQIGRAKYVLEGEPFEYVFREINGTAQVSGLVEPARERVITNHLVSSQALADAAARNVLFRVQQQANTRRVEMIHDLRLEPDDVFETPDGRRYMIRGIQRQLRRGADAVIASVDAFEVTPGVLP